jgi:hypothetical protein
MNFEFKCPECGSLIGVEDNSKKIEDIKKEIFTIEEYLAKEQILLDKKKVKRNKSVQKLVVKKGKKGISSKSSIKKKSKK